MSQFKIKTPVIHIPSFREYKISAAELSKKYRDLNIAILFPISDYWYYHSDLEGWSKILPDLAIKSSLYRPDRFDCEDFSLKAQTVCAERYGLNTLRYVYGDTPLGKHGFNIFFTGEEFLLFEPNDGFECSGQAFPIGEFGYIPVFVFI